MSGDSSNSNHQSKLRLEEKLILIDRIRGLIRNSEITADSSVAAHVQMLITRQCKNIHEGREIIQGSGIEDSPFRIAIERCMSETLYTLCFLGDGPWQFNPVTCYPYHTLEEIRELIDKSGLRDLPCKGAIEWSEGCSSSTTWLELIDAIIVEVGDLEKRNYPILSCKM